MTTASASSTAPPKERRGSEWLTDWQPEDPAKWDKGLAWRTLSVTTFNLTLAFVTWFLASALAPKLNNIGFSLTTGQLYWLTAMPGLAGGTLRILWTFLPPVMGTRKMVAMTTALLLIPLVGWALAIQDPSTPYGVLILLALLSGIGGGAFSGFMPSTSYFFPRRMAGTALGIQAGIGNFGVSLVQFVVPWIVSFSMLGFLGGAQQYVDTAKGVEKDVWYQNAAYVWIPFVVVGVALAWTMLKSVPITANFKQQWDIFGNKHTWVMTALYIMTFGTFSGLAGAFGLLIKNIYGAQGSLADVPGWAEVAPDPVQYVFLGALVGAATRVAMGPLADRLGGAALTTVSAVGLIGSTIFTIGYLAPDVATAAEGKDSFQMFLWGMLAIFFFAGIGNASTFKQMPMIFPPRQAGGVIGWTSAVAAYGPFLFGVALAAMAPVTFFWILVAFFVVCLGLNVWFYVRPGAEIRC